MSPKALQGLLTALLALAVLWVIRDVLSTRANKPELLFPTAADAARLELGGVRLEKAGGEWTMASPFRAKADQERAARLLETLAKARLSEVLASDEAKHDLFGVTESSGLRLKAETPRGASLDVLIGRQGAAPGTLFARWPPSDEVREVFGLERWELSAEPGDWADKTAAALDPTRITLLELRRKGERTLTLLQDSGRWRVNGAREDLASDAVQKSLQPVLTALSRLELDGVSASTRAFAPELSVLVEAFTPTGEASEEVLLLEAGPLDKATYRHPVRVKGRAGLLYEASPFRLEPFRLKAADLK